MIFPFKKKGFLYKSLCSYVVVLSLYLLKFIHSYIKFFPTLFTNTPKEKKFFIHILSLYYPQIGGDVLNKLTKNHISHYPILTKTIPITTK